MQKILHMRGVRLIYRAIDRGGDFSQTQTGLVHSHHPIPQFGSRLVDASRLAHPPRLRGDGPSGGFKSHATCDVRERSADHVTTGRRLRISFSLLPSLSLSKLGSAAARDHPDGIRSTRNLTLGLTQ